MTKDRKKFSTHNAYKEQYGNEEIADTKDIAEIFKNFKLGDSNE